MGAPPAVGTWEVELAETSMELALTGNVVVARAVLAHCVDA